MSDDDEKDGSMNRLTELIDQLRSKSLTEDEFATIAASEYVHSRGAAWPETDGNADYVCGVSPATLANAVGLGLMTRHEADLIVNKL